MGMKEELLKDNNKDELADKVVALDKELWDLKDVVALLLDEVVSLKSEVRYQKSAVKREKRY
jgi:hypothetical protein